MNRILKQSVLLLMTVLGALVSKAQAAKEIAVAKAKEAIQLEDEQGKYDDAIKLFEQASLLDPDNISYPYEMAYAYTSKKDYRKAVEILEKLLSHKDVYGQVFQALGNNYDYLGKPDKAIATYEKGIKLFPNAGELYLELGNMHLSSKEYNEALKYYEQGIEHAPEFPSNYYWAARLYCSSDEEVWGMIYGEIFVNLERNSKRTTAISKMLYDTYKGEIKFDTDSSFSVSFSKNSSINISAPDNQKKIRMPFPLMVYEPLLSLSVIGEKQIDIHSLNRIRTRFLESYFKGDNAKQYPNVLFDYLQQVKSAGQLEAYHYWFLAPGDQAASDKWVQEHKTQWDSFLKWFTDNPLKLNQAHKFYRAQY